MKKLAVAALVLGFCSSISAGNLITVAESSNFTKTSLYADVMSFLLEAQRNSDLIRIVPFTTSTEGRMIPMAVLSRDPIRGFGDLRVYRKPAILIMANIHAGEIEGKEACLMLIRDIITGGLPGALDNQVLLIIPIYNPDGNEKLGKNRGDNGPELAGVRPNGQNLDLNRDYPKLESPETRALIELFNTWDPLLIVDMHTTDGSYHRNPVTYATLADPNTSRKLRDFMWQDMFPAVSGTLKSTYGYDSVPYGNFVNREKPEEGWTNDSIDPRYGSNYVGLRNRLSILDENYSHADYKTRVLSSHAFIRSIVEYTSKNISRMADLISEVDVETARSFAGQPFALEYKVEKLFDVTIKSFEFRKEPIKPEDKAKYPPWVGDFLMRPTDVLKEYRVPYFADAVPTRTVPLPAGYVLMPFEKAATENLLRHGIRVERLQAGCRMEAENFKLEKIELDENIYQGHVLNKLSGRYEKREVEFAEGCRYVPMNQPLARLIPVLLEPESTDSLAVWGFFNRVIVRQWSDEPGDYPVYRVHARPPVPMVVEGE